MRRNIEQKVCRRTRQKRTKERGRKSKLSMEDKLLATLEYLREYRTYAHIAANYGVHESAKLHVVSVGSKQLLSKTALF